MNREILFRGKESNSGKWVYGYLWSKRTIGVTSPVGNVDEVVVDPATVGQYTGLTDRNGKRIFEGDILKIDDELFVVKYGNCGGVKNVGHEVGYVGFYVNPCGKDAEKLLSYGMRTDILYWMNGYGVNVIGNVHDNP